MEAVILTKSHKKDKYNVTGWCVVAFDLRGRRLVRFVDEGGAGIQKMALDGKDIEVLDKVSVDVIRELPHGPQTENLLVNTSSFRKLGVYEAGIGRIIKLIPPLSDDEPLFMDDCEHKYMDAGCFHHSIEIVEIRNHRSCLSSHNDNEPRRYSQFDTDAGHNSDIRITVPKFYNLDHDWKTDDAVAIMTIPMEPWIKNGINCGYFKFMAALYKIPPTEEEEKQFLRLIRQDPRNSSQPVRQALEVRHIDAVEPYVNALQNEGNAYKAYCDRLLWKTDIQKDRKTELLVSRDKQYTDKISELRAQIGCVMSDSSGSMIWPVTGRELSVTMEAVPYPFTDVEIVFAIKTPLNDETEDIKQYTVFSKKFSQNYDPVTITRRILSGEYNLYIIVNMITGNGESACKRITRTIHIAPDYSPVQLKLTCVCHHSQSADAKRQLLLNCEGAEVTEGQ